MKNRTIDGREIFFVLILQYGFEKFLENLELKARFPKQSQNLFSLHEFQPEGWKISCKVFLIKPKGLVLLDAFAFDNGLKYFHC